MRLLLAQYAAWLDIDFPGAYGIVTVKNMLEVGFDVVAYDRNDYIGGLWTVTTDPSKTSVLPSEFFSIGYFLQTLIDIATISNQSKQRVCLTNKNLGGKQGGRLTAGL